MRIARPSLVVFALALIASLSVHLPVYQVLGALADTLLHEPAAAPAGPTTVEFELTPSDEGETPATSDEVAEVKPKAERPKPEPPAKLEKPQAKPRKQAPKPPEPVAVAPPPTPPPPPQPARQPKQQPLAVEQRSDNPDVEPPPDAQYIAEENRRVEEETVARIRNLREDAPKPEAGQAPSEAESEEEGAGDETKVADLQEVKGDESRRATDEEASLKPTRPSPPIGGGVRSGDTLPDRASSAPKEEVAEAKKGVAKTGGEETTITINDGNGTIVIRKPKVGSGPGDGGDTRPLGERDGRTAQRGTASGRTGPDLRISFRQYEDTFGAENLEAQREAYVAQNRSRKAGRSRSARWKKFRGAIENYVAKVKSGDQTALNAAASPFAAFIAAVHRRIHSEYALGFLRNLPIAGGPFDDASLYTKLEIIINGDGSLHQVGVLQTSGLLPFDFGAFDAVMRAAPFTPPPRKILSGDGRAYIHWGFHRDMRQCGTFNAEGFILRAPGDTPAPGSASPLQDQDSPPPRDVKGSEMGLLHEHDGHLHEGAVLGAR